VKVVLDELDDIKANVANVAQRMHGKSSALSDPDIDVKLNELRIDDDVVILLILELRVFLMQFLSFLHALSDLKLYANKDMSRLSKCF